MSAGVWLGQTEILQEFEGKIGSNFENVIIFIHLWDPKRKESKSISAESNGL